MEDSSRKWSLLNWIPAGTDVSLYLTFLLGAILLYPVAKMTATAIGSNLNLKPGIRIVPGPLALPVIGNALQLGPHPFITFVEWAKKYGDVFQIRIGSRPVVVLNGRNAIHQALVRQSVHFAGRPDLESLRTFISGNAGSFAFSTYSERWKLQRKLATTVMHHFTSGRQSVSVERLVTFEASELIKFVLGDNACTVFDPFALLKTSVSNVMGNIIFQKRHGLDDQELKTLIKGNEQLLSAISANNLIDFMPWLGAIFPGKMRELWRAAKNFKELLDVYIKDHEDNYEPGLDSDMLYYLMTLAGDLDPREMEAVGLTRNNMHAIVVDMFEGGIDTVATTLSWTFLYIIYFPEMQTAIQEEIDSVVGRDRLPSLADRGRLPLTESFLAEVARHVSVVPISVPHCTTSDTVLEGGYDYFIPKDTLVFVNLYSVQHDPEQFVDPQEFKPRRFLSDDGSKLDVDKVDSMMRFSAGRRRCLGYQVAQMEVFLFFTVILHQCSLKNVKGQELSIYEKEPSVVLKPQSYKMEMTIRL